MMFRIHLESPHTPTRKRSFSSEIYLECSTSSIGKIDGNEQCNAQMGKKRVINVNHQHVQTGWRQAIFHSGIFVGKAMNGNEIFEVRA